MRDRAKAVEWARELLARDDWLILDTETTGLSTEAEICQIAVIDSTGAPLLDTLVEPRAPIPGNVIRIHGITNETVANAPGFEVVWEQLRPLIADKELVIYNAAFDRNKLASSLAWVHCPYDQNRMGWWDAYETALDEIVCKGWPCAMTWYAQYVGDWNRHHGNYRYQKLPGGDHSAFGDARATLAVIQRMAGVSQKGNA